MVMRWPRFRSAAAYANRRLLTEAHCETVALGPLGSGIPSSPGSSCGDNEHGKVSYQLPSRLGLLPNRISCVIWLGFVGAFGVRQLVHAPWGTRCGIFENSYCLSAVLSERNPPGL